MARKKLVQSPNHPYHITARSNNGAYLGLEPETLWNIYNDYLHFLSTAFEVKIHAFVMMSNHFHLIASFPKLNISLAMNRFMTESARAINFERMTINHIYGSRYFACLIDNERYYRNVFRYLFQNPVRAGICTYVEDYSFSTLSGLLGQTRLSIPIHHFSSPFVPEFSDLESHLSFLNQPINLRTLEATRFALRRTHFKYSVKYREWAKAHGETDA
ncbi:MAG: transposase [Deltaproteobacteria bacterium]|nr:transposase [Deltaproteobacteria bacterium]